MKLLPTFYPLVVFVCAGVCAGSAFAQRPGANAASAKPALDSYNIANDVSLQGTVLNFTENSQTAPLGAHVLLQTSAGKVDVHLGDARFLRLAKLNINQSARPRFVAQVTPAGKNQFFPARRVQIGAQVVAVPPARALPLGAAGLRANKALLLSAQ